jgi:hypothetical protein
VTVKPPETPAETLETLARRMDHMDVMLHEVHQFITENRPHLERALQFMEPGRAMKAYLAGRPKPRSKP